MTGSKIADAQAHLIQGLSMDDNALAKDALREPGIGGNFLGVEHTLKNFRTANF